MTKIKFQNQKKKRNRRRRQRNAGTIQTNLRKRKDFSSLETKIDGLRKDIKEDFGTFKAEIKQDFIGGETRMEASRTEIKEEVKALLATAETIIEASTTELKQDFADFENEMTNSWNSFLIIITFFVGNSGIVLSAITKCFFWESQTQ